MEVVAHGAAALSVRVPGAVTTYVVRRGAGPRGRWATDGPERTDSPAIDARSDRQNGVMGFDATRAQRRRRSDGWIVAAAILVCLLLVAWALLA